jgi:hypothetical protein
MQLRDKPLLEAIQERRNVQVMFIGAVGVTQPTRVDP